MLNEVNDVKVEVEENENNGLKIIDLPPVEVEKVDDEESSETTLSAKEMVAGGLMIVCAAIGVGTLGRGVYKLGSWIAGKIKDKRSKKDEVIPPPTEEINEQPVVVEATDVEVKDEESTTK